MVSVCVDQESRMENTVCFNLSVTRSVKMIDVLISIHVAVYNLYIKGHSMQIKTGEFAISVKKYQSGSPPSKCLCYLTRIFKKPK
mgnify:CR=1 FL=1